MPRIKMPNIYFLCFMMSFTLSGRNALSDCNKKSCSNVFFIYHKSLVHKSRKNTPKPPSKANTRRLMFHMHTAYWGN